MMTPPTPESPPGGPLSPTVRYEPRGGALEALLCRAPEALLDGPAGTGKSFGMLWKGHLAAIKYPGMHGLLLRKTLVSLKSSTLVTFRERILGPNSPVRFWTAKGDEAAHYAYPNGSKLYVGGMDNPSKIMSTEFDMILPDEATELELNEWEALTTRLRYGHMPYQQLLAACNPQAPTHWLNQRANEGRLTRILSRHEDNPTVTPAYMEALERLTGVRKARLLYGIWAAAEGTVYEDAWDAARNIIERKTVSARPDDLYGDCGVPRDWPRYLAVDFGVNHPFVCQWWAEDNDGRLYLYREIYMTHKLVEDHAETIRRYSRWGATPTGDPLPRAIICDHDLGERGVLERKLGLHTIAAYKGVTDGIQAVAARMRAQMDGRPRLYLLRDATIQRDSTLVDARQPTCTAEEPDSYVWKLRGQGKQTDEPEKEYDHGLDALRYMVAYKDLKNLAAKPGARLF